MKILVVDDKDEGRYLLETLLKAKGHDVASASNGLEAKDRLEAEHFDLVISDVLMPVMDGFELCRWLRTQERFQKTPFVVYTATYTGPEDQQFALGIGADRFIQKPCEPELLIQAIEETAASTGKYRPIPSSKLGENQALRLYNERLIRKLEQRALELEREVQARREVEAALVESEERYRLVVENALDVIGIVQEDRFRFINRRATELLGYSKKEFMTRPFWEFVYPEDKAMVLDYYGKRITGQDTPVTYSFRVLGKEGDVRWVETIAISIEYERRPAVLSFLKDITDRKKAEEELVQLQEQLRQAQKMEAIGRLSGGIAHDFNNLLTVIQGNAQLASIGLKDGDPLKDLLREILGASTRASELTRHLLAFSRRQVMNLRVLDLNEVLSGIRNMLRRIIGEDIELIMHLQEGIGNVKADPGQLEQVVMNLAVNARDAMPQGGKLMIETAKVELDEAYARRHLSLEPGLYIMLSVTDTGTGIATEIKERLFEPFFTTKEPGKGTGLGLAVVYGIVKQLGGHIWVYSEPGQGASFRIYLPRVEEPVEGKQDLPAKRHIPAGRETLLLVEDEKAVRELTARILRELGYEVLEAACGEEALEICDSSSKKVDLLLTDVVMPGIGGINLLERLKAVYPGLKVLYMSGYTGEAILQKGIFGTRRNFISKPFAVEDLARKVREALDG